MARHRRLESPQALLVTIAAGLALVVGGLAGANPKLAIVVAIGLMFVALVFANLLVGFAAMVMFAYLEVLTVLGGVSLAKVAGALIVVAWLAVASTSGGRVRNFFVAHPGIVYLLVAFVGWNAISVLWSESAPATWESVMRYGLNAVLLPVAFTAVRSRRDLIRILAVLVAGASVAAISAIVSPPSPESAVAGRATGTVGDPNELASGLVVGLAVSLAFAVNRRVIAPLRAVSAAVALFCLLGILVSLSRGGLIGVGAAVFVAVLASGRWRGRVLAVAGCVVAAGVIYFALFASLPAKERVLNVSSGGGTGRLDLWTVGFRMVAAHPLEGVGSGQFPISSVHYLLRPGVIERGDLILSTPKVTHNTYLNILAEVGIVGGVMFLAILVFCVGCAVLAVRQLRRDGDQELEILARGLLIGIGGYLTTLLFISENYSKLLWILLALGPVMLAVARAPSESEEPARALPELAPVGGLAPAGLRSRP